MTAPPPRLDDDAWGALCDALAASGRADAAADVDPPTDADLWACARRYAPGLPEPLDALVVGDLRAAYDEGRQPTRIDLDAVAVALRARGYPARVQHSGSNAATLYAGWRALDSSGEARWSVAAGPGWFERPGRQQPAADTTEFHIGPDTDQTTWTVGVPEQVTARRVADIVAAAITLVHTIRGDTSPCLTASASGGLVRRVLCLSTAHLPRRLGVADGLDTLSAVHAYRTDAGFLLPVPEDPDQAAAATTGRVPDVVLNIQRYARARGADFVLLDRDADQVADLPTWDR